MSMIWSGYGRVTWDNIIQRLILAPPYKIELVNTRFVTYLQIATKPTAMKQIRATKILKNSNDNIPNLDLN